MTAGQAPPAPATATIAFLGDVMLGRHVSEERAHRRPEWFWGTALPVLRRADAVVANLECALTRGGRPWSRTPKVFRFRADPGAVDILRAAGVTAVCLANNHVLDFETEGLADTLAHLDRAGIAHVGAGADLAEARRPAIVQAGPLRLGLAGVTDNEPPFAAGPDRPGVDHRAIEAGSPDAEALASTARSLRRDGVDLCALSLHWGPNMVETPPERYRRFAATMIAAGFGVIHGHSAHVVQGVERHGAGVALYDTGDVIDDYAVEPRLRNDRSLLFLIDADRDGPRRLRMLPLSLSFARVDLAEGREFEAIRGLMRRRCRMLGTVPDDCGEGLQLDLRPPPGPAPAAG